MTMVLAKCKMCGEKKLIPRFQINPDGCKSCLGDKYPTTPNRGLLKKKRKRI